MTEIRTLTCRWFGDSTNTLWTRTSLVPNPTVVRPGVNVNPLPVMSTLASAPAGREDGVMVAIAGLAELLEFRLAESRGGPLPLEPRCGRQNGREPPGRDSQRQGGLSGIAQRQNVLYNGGALAVMSSSR